MEVFALGVDEANQPTLSFRSTTSITSPAGYHGNIRMMLAKRCARAVTQQSWDFIGYEDLGEVVGNCDLCGTAIRYVFVVHHPHWPAMEVGEVCCDHLTSTQIATNHMESMRRFRDRQQRFVSSSRWEVASHGAHSIKQKGFAIQVESRPDGGYRLRVNGRLGKKRFLCVEDAKKMVFEIIESGTAKKYFDRHN
jgi:hypothetical protein